MVSGIGVVEAGRLLVVFKKVILKSDTFQRISSHRRGGTQTAATPFSFFVFLVSGSFFSYTFGLGNCIPAVSQSIALASSLLGLVAAKCTAAHAAARQTNHNINADHHPEGELIENRVAVSIVKIPLHEFGVDVEDPVAASDAPAKEYQVEDKVDDSPGQQQVLESRVLATGLDAGRFRAHQDLLDEGLDTLDDTADAVDNEEHGNVRFNGTLSQVECSWTRKRPAS